MKEGKDVLGDPRAAHVIAGAGLCYVGVQSDHGPHVTPEAFAVAAGRIWFVTSFRSVKVRAIRRHPEVGLLMRADGGSLVLSGHAEVLSLWSPREAARLAVDALPALEAVGSYGIRNVPTLLGYALDLCRLPGGALPIDRVLVSVRPGSALLLDPDDVAQAWGGWTLPAPPVERGRAAGHPPAPAAEALDDVPSDVAELLAEPAGATVGWPTDGGPVPLPASWDPTRGTVEVSARALDAVRAHANGPACVTLDRSDVLRPTRYLGVILRGAGRPVGASSELVELTVRPERVTWWRGFRTGTLRVPATKRSTEREPDEARRRAY